MSAPATPVDLAACCTPLSGGLLDDEAARRLAGMFKALADPARVRLVSLISSAAEGEACVCDLTAPLGLAQPTVSHHLRLLVDAGVLTREQRGRWAYYRVVPETLAALSRALVPPTA